MLQSIGMAKFMNGQRFNTAKESLQETLFLPAIKVETTHAPVGEESNLRIPQLSISHFRVEISFFIVKPIIFSFLKMSFLKIKRPRFWRGLNVFKRLFFLYFFLFVLPSSRELHQTTAQMIYLLI